jgi:ABC-type sugar transport system permease subunit
MATPTVHGSAIGLRAAQPAARVSWFKKSQRILGRDWPIGWLFFLPTLALLFGLIGYPFVRAIFLSLFNVVGVREGPFVGLLNYQNLWSDDQFWRSIYVSAWFTVVSEIFKFIIGLTAALLLHNAPRFSAVLGGLILMPYIIPDVVRALAWRILLDPLFGALNFILVNVLHVMDKGPSWLGDAATALPSVTGVNVWGGIPFFVILFLAGLKSIDNELYDAAAVDGANAWRRFLHITLPGLRYVIIVVMLLSTIFTFNGFTLTYLLTGGGPGGATRVYSILAYEYAIQALRFSTGVAVAVSVAPFLFILILFLGRYMMRREDIAHSTQEEGRVWQAFMLLMWPVRMVVRGIMAVFWFLNGLAESAVGAVGGVAQRQAHRSLHRALRASGSHSVRRDCALLFHFRDLVQEHAPDSANPEHVLADAVDDGALHVLVPANCFPELVPQHHHRGGRGHSGIAVCRQPWRIRARPPQVARHESAELGRPRHVFDARGALVHPAVRLARTAAIDQHARRFDGDVPSGSPPVCDVADDGLLPLDP